MTAEYWVFGGRLWRVQACTVCTYILGYGSHLIVFQGTVVLCLSTSGHPHSFVTRGDCLSRYVRTYVYTETTWLCFINEFLYMRAQTGVKKRGSLPHLMSQREQISWALNAHGRLFPTRCFGPIRPSSVAQKHKGHIFSCVRVFYLTIGNIGGKHELTSCVWTAGSLLPRSHAWYLTTNWHHITLCIPWKPQKIRR